MATRRLAGFGLVLGFILSLQASAFAAAYGRMRPPRVAYHAEAEFDQVLRENALFFNLLVTFSLTASWSGPAWQVDVKNININLISREIRDPQGRQIVRVRVAGNVRKNNNVELDLLDAQGTLVGRGFYGYDSGQLSFYDSRGRSIIEGYVDSSGTFFLYDMRLPEGRRDLSRGFLDPCFYCGSMDYEWYDGKGADVGGGRIFPYDYYNNSGSVRLYWSFESGKIAAGRPAYGEADYILKGETTGAVNSALFDMPRSAESFFANPYSLVPKPAGRALLPRVTNNTGIAVTNPSAGEVSVTYVARHYNGALVSGEGIENPVTYRFDPGLQFAAFPGEIFRGSREENGRGIFGRNEVGWVEIFSYEGDVQAIFLEGDPEARALDGNIGAGGGSAILVFPDLRLGEGESSEIELLNLSFDDVMVRLELLDRSGRVLGEAPEFFISGYGVRTFFIGPGSGLLGVQDWSQAGALRAACNNENSLKSASCEELVGLATYKDRFGSTATSYAVGDQDAGRILLGTQVVAGGSGSGFWRTTVMVAKLDGSMAPVSLDLYDGAGNLLLTLQESVARGGQATFPIDGSAPPWRDQPLAGYVRVRSESGRIAGTVHVWWDDGQRSLYSSYPLVGYISALFRFNQVAHGAAGGIEYWTGLALLNDWGKQVRVRVEVYGPDGAPDRSTEFRLEPYQQKNGLLSKILRDDGYERLDGYIVVSASDPISAIVLYGDTGSQFLASVPGIPR